MTETRSIDLNADVGEGFDDAAVMPYVTSINIACGGHAGDDESMRRAIMIAAQHSCAIGAHPGYADPEHLGRRAMALSPRDVTVLVTDQVRRLDGIARAAGTALRHVKPHGALYNQAATDPALARAVAAGVAAADGALTLVGLAGSELIDAARAAGLDAAAEGFCDRGYRPDGTLIPRGSPGAMIEDPSLASQQALAIATEGPLSGAGPVIRARTICLHADTPGAAALGAAVRRALEAAGIRIVPL